MFVNLMAFSILCAFSSLTFYKNGEEGVIWGDTLILISCTLLTYLLLLFIY